VSPLSEELFWPGAPNSGYSQANNAWIVTNRSVDLWPSPSCWLIKMLQSGGLHGEFGEFLRVSPREGGSD